MTLFPLLGLQGPWLVFAGTIVLGESVVLSASALAATGAWSLTSVVLASFAGTMLADALWFASAEATVARWSTSPERAARLDRATARMDRLVGDRPHLGLLFAKFLYGTRIAAIVYLASRGMSRTRFLVFDAAGTCVWLAVLVPIGWGVGRGLDRYDSGLRWLKWIVLAAAAVALVTKGVTAWRSSRREV